MGGARVEMAATFGGSSVVMANFKPVIELLRKNTLLSIFNVEQKFQARFLKKSKKFPRDCRFKERNIKVRSFFSVARDILRLNA